MAERIIKINRAPVLTLWAAMEAEHSDLIGMKHSRSAKPWPG